MLILWLFVKKCLFLSFKKKFVFLYDNKTLYLIWYKIYTF